MKNGKKEVQQVFYICDHGNNLSDSFYIIVNSKK